LPVGGYHHGLRKEMEVLLGKAHIGAVLIFQKIYLAKD